MKTKIIAGSVFLGLLVCFIDVILDYYFFFEGSFWDILILNIPAQELYVRLMTMTIFLVSGVILSTVITKLLKTEQEVKDANQLLVASNLALQNDEKKLDKLNHDLGERVKELQCLYGLSRLCEHKHITLEEIFQGFVELISPGWHYPEITCVRLIIHNNHYQTDIFQETPWSQSASIQVHGANIGMVHVFYLEEKPILDEGPFLDEERSLIDALAERLGHIIERKQAEAALHQYKHIVSSTSDMMALLDTDYTYLTANSEYIKTFNLTWAEVVGKTISNVFGDKFFEDVIKPNADRCLAGEKVMYKEWFDFPAYQSRFMEIRYYPYIDENNNIKGFVVNGRDITEQKQAEMELQKYHTQLQSLSVKLSLTEARERRDIAGELHDHIGQDLALSMIKLGALKKQVSADNIASSLDEISVLIEKAFQDTQSLTFDLSFSSLLQKFGFERSLAQWMQQRVQEHHGILTEFVDDGQVKPMTNDVGVLVFQAVRELLINVIKHSQATSVKVSIQRKQQQMETIIQDNGVGFNPSQIESDFPQNSGGGFGLFSIKERLNHFGGQIKIESETGCGTQVTLLTPLQTETITEGIHVH